MSGPPTNGSRIRNTEGQETVIKDGKIFLVKGLIANGSTKPRKYVILKAKLFDEHGTVIGEHFALAGLPLSVEEVREMRGAEIEKKVADFRLSNLSAFVLRKGGRDAFFHCLSGHLHGNAQRIYRRGHGVASSLSLTNPSARSLEHVRCA